MTAYQLHLPFKDPEVENKYVLQDKHFEEVASAAKRLFQRKNREYENTIVHTGLLGASVELVGIGGRLKALILHRHFMETFTDDITKDVHNAFMDAIVYGVIGIMMLETGNLDGER